MEDNQASHSRWIVGLFRVSQGPAGWTWNLSGLLKLRHRFGIVALLLQSTVAVVVQSPRCVWLFTTPWIAACQASLSLTISRSLPKFMFMHQWCHPAISSSDTLSSFCPQSFPASGTFPISHQFTSDDQNTVASASALPVKIQGWSPLRLTGLISLLSKGL